MDLTQRERAYVERLERSVRLHRKTRIFVLSISIIAIVGVIYAGNQFTSLAQDMLDKWQEAPLAIMLYLVLFVPKLYLIAIFAGCALGLTMKHWHGNPKDTILLKLVRDTEGSINK